MTLFDANGDIIEQPDLHDPDGVSALDAELLRCAAAEFDALEREDEPMSLLLSPLVAVQLAGLLQLALQHEGTQADIRDAGRSFLQAVREYFAESPAVLEVLRRGDDTTQDVPR
ncbi:MAG: hypothetical protein ABJA98_01610 [Acidobacteriota bacterium]